jgi:aspartyl protease family protein
VSGPGGDQALTFIYLLGCLVLVVSALMVRRVPMAHALKVAAGWVLIFAAVFTGFALKDDFAALGRRVLAAGAGEQEPSIAGKEVRIHKSPDGHFWVNAEVNGVRIPFLVDSGATTTSLSTGAARRAGVEPSDPLPVLIDTANGMVSARRATIERLRVGGIERKGLKADTADAFGDTNVLGMNFLSSLHGWGVEGEWLVLKP